MSDLQKRAEAALARAEQDTKNWPGPCHQCRYRKPWLTGGNKPSTWDYCTNELARLETFNAATGYDGKYPEVGAVRGSMGMCGPDGKLFEPSFTTRASKQGFWRTLFGK